LYYDKLGCPTLTRGALSGADMTPFLGTRIQHGCAQPDTTQDVLIVRVRQLLLLGVLVFGLVYSALGQTTDPAGTGADIEVFMREGCPSCAAAKRFLEELQRERPALRMIFHDIGADPAALARLMELAEKHRVQGLGVPAFYLHGELIIGYLSEATTGGRLKALLDRPASRPGEEGLAETHSLEATELWAQGPAQRPTASEAIDVPLFGSLSVKDLGLPVFTLIIGLLDGFNPCAMWLLLFLLSLLVNLRSRTKMLLIGGTFVAVSGFAYFAFMAAWLNVFLFIGFSRMVQVALGGIAGLVGAINVKDFFALHKGISLSIPEAAKPGLYSRIRRILQAENLPGALAGVIVLAVLVNMIELLCTAGFPAVYTQILTLRQLPWWEYYAYLGLYNLVYMLDDSLMLTVAVVTLGHHKLQENEGRWLKLISGVVMLALAVVLIAKPEWLAA
jgi:glutaredoxin